MVFFVTAGETTRRRPYISSSNYIKKMSNYTNGDWTNKWNDLYKQFINKHKGNCINLDTFLEYKLRN